MLKVNFNLKEDYEKIIILSINGIYNIYGL